jgi:uncharacterized protein (UPF0332 family)
MMPEAQLHLDKARDHLIKAQDALEKHPDEAGRCASLAAFHSAQAMISERTGRVAKTPAGAHSQFNLLAKNEPRIDGEMRRFLSDAFDLKATADYELGPDAVVSTEEAEAAIAAATRFVDRIAEILV